MRTVVGKEAGSGQGRGAGGGGGKRPASQMGMEVRRLWGCGGIGVRHLWGCGGIGVRRLWGCGGIGVEALGSIHEETADRGNRGKCESGYRV